MSDFRDKLLSLHFAKGKHPTQVREDHLSQDLDAYARLKRNGKQPVSIDGCAELERRATDDIEFKYGLAKTEKGLAQAKAIEAGLE